MRTNRPPTLTLLALMLLVGGITSSAAAEPQVSLASMSVPQMVTDSEGRLSEMSEMLKNGFKLIEEARANQDVAQTTCIADALTPMKGLLKLAERNKIALQEAASRSDRDGVEHEAIKISIAHSKFVELDAQVRSCGGPDSEGTVDGRPVIDKIVDSDLPESDPTEDLKDVEVLLERPVSASQSK